LTVENICCIKSTKTIDIVEIESKNIKDCTGTTCQVITIAIKNLGKRALTYIYYKAKFNKE